VAKFYVNRKMEGEQYLTVVSITIHVDEDVVKLQEDMEANIV